jgi:hypothetical protein
MKMLSVIGRGASSACNSRDSSLATRVLTLVYVFRFARLPKVQAGKNAGRIAKRRSRNRVNVSKKRKSIASLDFRKT